MQIQLNYLKLLSCSISIGNWLCCSQARFQSSFLHNLSRRLLGGAHATTSEVAQKNDPEAVIREFESQSSLHANPAALSEYVKALVKLDRLDQSQFFLNTLQRGWLLFGFCFHCISISLDWFYG
jgi:ATP-dependent metalloprotease